MTMRSPTGSTTALQNLQSMLKISAIICTFKRPDYLRQALQSLCEQSLPRDEYEIIVVDNAVDSEIEQIVREFDDGRINLRYLAEERVGLSLARNTGLMAAVAPYVAYIDDDARAETHWLEALVDAFAQTSPPPAAVGGRVWLDWHGEKPSWVPERHLSLFTYVDHGNGAHSLANDEYLVGANIAFEKEALRSVGGFDPNLGRQGAVLLSGEESAIIAQFQRMKKDVYYEPAAVVWHSVDQSRKRPSWLLRRLFWDGASQPLIDVPTRPRSRRATSLNAYRDLRQCGRWSCEILVSVLKGRRGSAWESLLGLSQRAGRLRTEVRMLASNSN
jgi:glucosyl-dolichyl phosphate glucuronosyltransferase